MHLNGIKSQITNCKEGETKIKILCIERLFNDKKVLSNWFCCSE